MTIRNRPNRRRALVVDDHGISGRFVSDQLESLGLAVRRARTAGQAVQIAIAWRPDLICMDYHLPDLDGLAASRKIRSQWPDRRTPPAIVLISGENSDDIRSAPDAAAVDRILVKPVCCEELKKVALGGGRSPVGESRADSELPNLRELFREELRRRLQPLDRKFLERDLAAVAAILHQLIASSAMCREKRLENALRQLDACCRLEAPPAELADAYYRVITSARECLGRERPPGG